MSLRYKLILLILFNFITWISQKTLYERLNFPNTGFIPILGEGCRTSQVPPPYGMAFRKLVKFFSLISVFLLFQYEENTECYRVMFAKVHRNTQNDPYPCYALSHVYFYLLFNTLALVDKSS